MSSTMRMAGKASVVLLLVIGGIWLTLARTAPAQPAKPQPQPKQPARSDEPLKSPLLKSLHDGIDGIKDSDNEFGDRGELKKSLREADGTLDRIRRENARALASANRQTPLPQQPNIVLIVVDDLPLEHLGCYGQKAIQTPHIDRLASRGARFTQFRTVAGDVSARWALLTGRSTPVGGPFALRPGEMTVAQALWRAAYHTAWIGDCSLGDANMVINPAELGFDYWYGTQDPATPYYPERMLRRGEAVDLSANAAGKRSLHINDAYSQHASEWVRTQRVGRARRPFFLLVTYRLPAKDWQAPEKDAYAQQNWPPSAKAWASMVTGVDRGIGDVMDALREAGQLKNTIVLVTAEQRRAAADGDDAFEVEDNPPEDGEAAKLGVRIPLIVYGPGRVAAGLVSDEPATLADLPPTLAALARFSKGTTGFPGESLGDTLLSQPVPPAVKPQVTETVPTTSPPAKPARKLPQIIRGRP